MKWSRDAVCLYEPRKLLGCVNTRNVSFGGEARQESVTSKMYGTTVSTSHDLLPKRERKKCCLKGSISLPVCRNNKQSVGAVSSCIPSKESKNDGNSAKNIFKKNPYSLWTRTVYYDCTILEKTHRLLLLSAFSLISQNLFFSDFYLL